MERKDCIVAEGKWTFDSNVTACFDDMLSRSIPDFATMRELTARMTIAFAGFDDPLVVDIGCSSGGSLAPIIDHYQDFARYIGFESSQPMREACKARFGDRVKILDLDLRYEWPENLCADVVQSIFTIQFVPIEFRPGLLARIYASLRPGGALVITEKVLSPFPQVNGLIVSEYYRLKERNGYSLEQINAKAESLQGVLVPLTVQANDELLRGAGFRQVECYWRALNFAGWIAVK